MTDSVPRVWEGVLYDGRSAVRRPVTMTIMETGLRLMDAEGATRWWPYAEIRQTAGDVRGERLRFERGANPPETLILADPAVGVALARYAPALGIRVRTSPARWRLFQLTLAAAAGAVVVLLGLYFWVIPAFADVLAARVPARWEERLGAAVVEQVLVSTERCAGEGGSRALSRIVTRLQDRHSRYTYRVSVVRVGLVNAFAAPGGHVVIFDGLLKRAATPEELAGVLAHEMQHVEQRHGTRNLIRVLSLRALVAMISGDAASMRRILETGGSLAGLSYSRADEASADREGMRMLQAAQVDPQGLVQFFEKMQKEESRLPAALTYLSNHPSTADRLAAMRALAAQATYTPAPLLDQTSWRELKMICAP